MLALDQLVLLRGLRRGVIRQLRVLGIVGVPIPRYDAQTGNWQTQKTSDQRVVSLYLPIKQGHSRVGFTCNNNLLAVESPRHLLC
jgi:hypothetical protein